MVRFHLPLTEDKTKIQRRVITFKISRVVSPWFYRTFARWQSDTDFCPRPSPTDHPPNTRPPLAGIPHLPTHHSKGKLVLSQSTKWPKNILPSITSPWFLKGARRCGIFTEHIDTHLDYPPPSPFEQHINYQLCCQMQHVVVFSITPQGRRRAISSAMGRDKPRGTRMKAEVWCPPSLFPPPSEPGRPGPVSPHRQEQRDQSAKWVSNPSKGTASLLLVKPCKSRQEKNISTSFLMAKEQVPLYTYFSKSVQRNTIWVITLNHII